jgi:hypothetical protein
MDQKFLVLDEKQFLEIREDLKIIRSVLESKGDVAHLKRWLNSKTTAEMLNIKLRTLYAYCQRGLLHPKKVGGILLFDRSEIEALIEGK